MNVCPGCSAENKDSSSHCRECGGPLGGRARGGAKRVITVVIVALAVAAAAAAATALVVLLPGDRLENRALRRAGEITRGVTGEGSSATESGTDTTKRVIPSPVHAVGKVVSLDGLELVVRGWEKSRGSGIERPDPGTDFVLVDLEVRNRSGEPYTVSSIVEMSLLSPDGEVFDHGLYFPEPRFPEGTVPAGGSASGKVSFQAPGKQNEFYFVFDPGAPVRKEAAVRLD